MKVKNLSILFCVVLFGCSSTQPAQVNQPCVKYGIITGDILDAKDVDIPPKMAGGLVGFHQRLTFPRSALKAGVKGVVMLEFIVDETGCVVNPLVTSDTDERLNKEALRVLKLVSFEPGQLDGSNIAVKMTLPVSFRL